VTGNTRASTANLAVTIKIDRDNPEIVVRRWELRPGQYSFRKVVGRLVDPSNPQEQDFTITQQKFGKLAEKAWRKQGFISVGMEGTTPQR